MDLGAIEEAYAEERGYPPYAPRMMVGLLLYAYCTGTYSARKIAAQLVDSVAFAVALFREPTCLLMPVAAL